MPPRSISEFSCCGLVLLRLTRNIAPAIEASPTTPKPTPTPIPAVAPGDRPPVTGVCSAAEVVAEAVVVVVVMIELVVLDNIVELVGIDDVVVVTGAFVMLKKDDTI